MASILKLYEKNLSDFSSTLCGGRDADFLLYISVYSSAFSTLKLIIYIYIYTRSLLTELSAVPC